MSHNIGYNSVGGRSFAFRGDRKDIWHGLGNQFQAGWTIDDWAKQSGLDWEAIKLPALVDCSSVAHKLQLRSAAQRVPNRHFVCRGDNGNVLSEGTVTDQYQIVQPSAVLDFFQQYVAQDSRFKIDTAMSLLGGQLIAVTATFDDIDVNGEKHKARLLCTTTFDGSGSTIAKGVMTRVVCNNTLSAALAEKDKTGIRVRHTTKFDPKVAGLQLAQIVQSFAKYKAMGEAMAKFHVANEAEVSKFFKLTLDIDLKAKREDISTAKFNQFTKLTECYQIGTRSENLEPNSGWAMMQAVSRYTDHEKTVRGSDGTPQGDYERRMLSANFGGAGEVMKAKAVQYLDDMSDGALLAAVSAATSAKRAAGGGDDKTEFAALLRQPLRG